MAQISDKSNISITIVIAAVSSALSIGVTYGLMKGDINDHERRINKIEQVDPGVLNNKIDNLIKQEDATSIKIDKLTNLLLGTGTH
jgi:hypothetical protein